MTISYHIPEQIISSLNSTTTPLTGGATYTGTWELVDKPDVLVSGYTDVAGTLYFDFSINGTDARTFPVNGFTVSGNIHEFHTAVKGFRYFRVRLVNGASAQSALQLQTQYGNFRQPNAPINQNIASDSDAILVRSVSSDLDLAFGRFDGMATDSKIGYCEDAGTTIIMGTPSTWVDLWFPKIQRADFSGTFTPYLASSDSADTDKSITISYLDANGLEQEVTISTDASDGQTPVSLGVTATEVGRAWANDAITGDISIGQNNSFTSGAVTTTTSDLLAYIPAKDNQTQQCIFTVPANKRRNLKSVHLSMLRDNGAAGAVIAVLQTKETSGQWRTRRKILVTTSMECSRDLFGLILEPLTKLRIRVRDVSDNGTYIEADIRYEDLEI